MENILKARDDTFSMNDAARGDDLPEGYFMSIQFIGTMAAFTLGFISTYVIFVMTTTVLTYINEDIGPSNNINWISIARTLGQSAVFVIQGRLSDLFGRRWFFIGGSTIALIGALLGAVAPNVTVLIISSVIYGMGESIQISYTAAVGELVPNEFRPTIMSIVSFCAVPFAALGPAIARMFIIHGLGWRWIYYLGVIVIGVATLLLFLFYHPPTFEMLHERKSKRKQIMELDFVGMGLWTSGLVLFLLGLSWGGGLYDWSSKEVIITLVLGLVTLIGFFFYESLAKPKYPTMALELFKNRGYITLVVVGSVAFMFYYSATLLWPQQVFDMYTSDIMYGGWLSCTVPAGVMGGSAFGGLFIRYGGNIRYCIIACAICMVAFVSGLAALTPETLHLGIALSFLGPFMVGVLEMASLSLAPLFLPPEDIGLAIGTLSCIRAAGASFALTVYTTIFNNRTASTFTSMVGAAAVNVGMSPDMIPALIMAIKAGTWSSMAGLTTAMKAAIKAEIPWAYSKAFQTVYLVSLAFGILAIIASFFVLDARHLFTKKVERRMHGRSIGGEIMNKSKASDNV
ncbi:fungal trichothecene efflux pump [Xylariales sp. PMI_506]|nr:fungal trichothecene efflux pump [Xylariales sp. PMI_506]